MASLAGPIVASANPESLNLMPDWAHAEHSTGVSYLFYKIQFQSLRLE